MARKTRSEYFCDACEKQVETSKELKRFFLGTKTTYRNLGFDLCVDCQRLLANVIPEHVGVVVGIVEEES